ncbi:MAG: hypothetical protein HOV81_30190 [Kofleriaceae bacterium]|nr:hypothetical protein [Kofleriaceae bacterium]
MRMVVGLAAVLAACAEPGDGRATNDGPLAMTFRLSVTQGDPSERGPSATPPTVYIDGVATESVTEVFDSEDASRAASFLLELRHGDVAVASKTIVVGDYDDCLDHVENATSANIAFCKYDSGELRYASSGASHEGAGGGQGCVGDGFCAPACHPASGCGEGLRCTSLIVSTTPLASHLGCAPEGPKSLGEACSLVPASGGDYDDCGFGLLCVESTCRTVCNPYAADACPAAETCAFVDGHAPEMRVCL